MDNELTSKEDSYNTVDSEEEEGKDDSVFEKEENEKEKKKSKEIEESFDWLKEYERRREEVLRQKKELENLEHKALRLGSYIMMQCNLYERSNNLGNAEIAPISNTSKCILPEGR